MLYWILKKLGQKHQWISGYKSYQQFDLKGHVEVTGVKKVTNFQNAPIELKFKYYDPYDILSILKIF